MLVFFDDPEIYGMNAIVVEGGRKMIEGNGHISISKYVELRRELSKHYLILDLWSD